MTATQPDLSILPELGSLIDEKVTTSTSGGVFEHVYAATGQPTIEVPVGGRAEIDAAVAAARRALPGWKALGADARRDKLFAVAEAINAATSELASLNVIDNSTPLLIATAQVGFAADFFKYNAGWADKSRGEVVATWPAPAFDYTLNEPYGVVGVIIPWNGPVTAVGQTLAPALAAGNTVVVKPPELTPFSVLKLGQIFLEAGIPPGVVNIVPGGPEAGAALVDHRDVDKVHFTGSSHTASAIMRAAADQNKPLGLELGGKSAVVVFDDASIDAAVGAAIAGCMSLSGQGCILGTRILLQRGIYDAAVEAISIATQGLPLGDPTLMETLMGPVIDQRSFDRINGIVDAAKTDRSGRLVAGEEVVDSGLDGGYYIRPTVFADVDPSSSLAQNEIFGPVQTLIPFDTEDEAISIANGTRYGLAGYVHTHDLKRAHRVADALEAGNIWVNGGFGIPSAVPFGGVKGSGFGRLGGIDGIREFSRPKNVWIDMG